MAHRRFLTRSLLAIAAGFAPVGCAVEPSPSGAAVSAPTDYECRALDGRELRAIPPADPARRAVLEAELAAAAAAHAAAPESRDAAIWHARRLGYLSRFREAIAVLDEALRRHPGDPFLLRHRGHRWISLRRFDLAVADLAAAAAACRTVADETEPDGQPTPGRPPHSSLHYNVFYHLGLARFLRGEWGAAEDAWLRCLAVADDDESRVAVCHWLWSVRMRRGDVAGATAVVAGLVGDLDVVENVAYLNLCRLYAGRLDRATIEPRDGSSGSALAFGLAHYDLVRGDAQAGRAALARLAADPGWSAFGVIAAEAELAR